MSVNAAVMDLKVFVSFIKLLGDVHECECSCNGSGVCLCRLKAVR